MWPVPRQALPPPAPNDVLIHPFPQCMAEGKRNLERDREAREAHNKPRGEHSPDAPAVMPMDVAEQSEDPYARSPARAGSSLPLIVPRLQSRHWTGAGTAVAAGRNANRPNVITRNVRYKTWTKTLHGR